MTPLQPARLYPREECITCANCVEVRGMFYCETNGKMLIPRFMAIGRCMGVPSRYKEASSAEIIERKKVWRCLNDKTATQDD